MRTKALKRYLYNNQSYVEGGGLYVMATGCEGTTITPQLSRSQKSTPGVSLMSASYNGWANAGLESGRNGFAVRQTSRWR